MVLRRYGGHLVAIGTAANAASAPVAIDTNIKHRGHYRGCIGGREGGRGQRRRGVVHTRHEG